MTIYVDSPREYHLRRKKYSHMITDGDLEELHRFAERIRVKRHWFDRDHYDLRSLDFEVAVVHGAIVVPSRRLIHILRQNPACKRFN